MIDIGGQRDYWRLLSVHLRPKVHVTLINLPGEIDLHRVPDEPGFTYVEGDGCCLEYEDRSFDLAHSNSMFEHVGSLSSMARFADEITRVADSYFVQTPYRWFPFDPHVGLPIFRWLPGPMRAQLLSTRKIGYADREECREALRTADGMELVDTILMRQLFADAELQREQFFGLTTSLIAIGTSFEASDTPRKRVLAVASGGGHWVQLRRLRRAWEGCAVTYVTTRAGYRDEIAEDDREVAAGSSAKFYVIPDANRWQKVRLIRQLLTLAWIILRTRPDAVVTTGAAPGYFAVRLGRLVGARTVWVDSIANSDKLSLSGERAGRYVDLWLTQWRDLAAPKGTNGPYYHGAVL